KPSLTIIGNGPEQKNLLQLISDLHLEEYVLLAGPLSGEDLAICLNRHRFLLVPSLWEEPFGNVVLEAMACGCLPIVSNGGGLPDAVGNAGLIFHRGDVNSLVSSITNILNNSALEQQLKSAAKNHLIAHYPNNVVLKYLDVIDSALHSHKKK
ncbi:MAG: glycosyltransferase, partial [Sphingobacteriaceae bacterium]